MRKPHNTRDSSKFFPLSLPLKYKAGSKEMAVYGIGNTSLLSSTEVIFTANQPVESGMECEISVAWPVLLEDHVRLQLIFEGRVLRTEGALVSAKICSYHFRTRGPWQAEPAVAPFELTPAYKSRAAAALAAYA